MTSFNGQMNFRSRSGNRMARRGMGSLSGSVNQGCLNAANVPLALTEVYGLVVNALISCFPRQVERSPYCVLMCPEFLGSLTSEYSHGKETT